MKSLINIPASDLEHALMIRITTIMKSDYFEFIIDSATENLNGRSLKKIKQIIKKCIYELLETLFSTTENIRKLERIPKYYEKDLSTDVINHANDVDKTLLQINIIVITCFDLACKTIFDYDIPYHQHKLARWLHKFLATTPETLPNFVKYAYNLEVFILEETEWRSCFITLSEEF